ncbi:MAG: hypothetical protein Ct9H300mP20_18580 [Gammaproteobacteria bacterium]|nr:MAG: hypothetical protein Ct9H300mP20_18580 [Gammaproteobacteria bacterium]
MSLFLDPIGKTNSKVPHLVYAILDLGRKIVNDK